LRNFIRSLPRWSEITIVLVAAFGLPIAGSAFAMGHQLFDPHYQYHYTSVRLEALLVIESILAVTLAPFLLARGWTAARIGLTTHATDIFWAVGLFVVYLIVWFAIWQIAYAVAPQFVLAMAHTPGVVFAHDIPLWAIVAGSLINPVIEETLECGYVMTVIDYRRNPWLAINVSVALRLCLHLYQGSVGVLGIVPYGLIFALWFAQTGRLWPLILAHAAQDFLGLYTATHN
jgi:membrane protease YdiL (CAAX protease family)